MVPSLDRAYPNGPIPLYLDGATWGEMALSSNDIAGGVNEGFPAHGRPNVGLVPH
jgi:hypothetical protein